MRITFLGQSGFAVDTGAQLLLFDYAPRRRRKLTETLLREMLENRRCTVRWTRRGQRSSCGKPAAPPFI